MVSSCRRVEWYTNQFGFSVDLEIGYEFGRSRTEAEEIQKAAPQSPVSEPAPAQLRPRRMTAASDSCARFERSKSGARSNAGAVARRLAKGEAPLSWNVVVDVVVVDFSKRLSFPGYRLDPTRGEGALGTGRVLVDHDHVHDHVPRSRGSLRDEICCVLMFSRTKRSRTEIAFAGRSASAASLLLSVGRPSHRPERDALARRGIRHTRSLQPSRSARTSPPSHAEHRPGE